MAAVDARGRHRGALRRARAGHGGHRAAGARRPLPAGRPDRVAACLMERPGVTRMTSDRMRRVNEAMREVLSGAITSELKDPRVGFVTVTAVETSPDLRHARVYVSVLGNPGERRRSLKALEHAHGFLQRRVAGELRIKHTPQLQFVYDDTAERGMRIAELLDQEDPA